MQCLFCVVCLFRLRQRRYFRYSVIQLYAFNIALYTEIRYRMDSQSRGTRRSMIYSQNSRLRCTKSSGIVVGLYQTYKGGIRRL